MTSLKEDAEKTRGWIAEEQKIELRQKKLATCIEDIEQIYQSNPKKATIREVMGFLYKSYLCTLYSEGSLGEPIYTVVSLGVRDRQDNKPSMYGDAWLRAEFFCAYPADDDKPIVSREFILGRFQVGVKQDEEFLTQDKEFVTLPTSSNSIDEHLGYIDEAIGLVADTLHLGRASSTPGVK